MKKQITAIILASSLATACTADQSAALQSTAQKALPVLTSLCNTGMQLAPLAGPYSIWIVGACGTAESITKLAADPSSLEWLDDLVSKSKDTSLQLKFRISFAS